MNTHLRRQLRDERGIALPTALIVLSILTIIAASLMVLARGNGRSAELSDARNAAFSLAESGSAEALAILRAASDPLNPNLVPSSGAIAREGGSVTYSATLDAVADPPVWTITATGTVDNPTGPSAADLTRTVVTRAEVVGEETGDVTQWDRVYHDHPTRCLVIDTITLHGSVTSRGDICLQNFGKIARRDDYTWIRVADDLITGPNEFVGSGTDPVDKVDVGGTCRKDTNTPHTPCDQTDNVWATESTGDAGVIDKPEIDLDHWYANAKPGPAHNCTVGSFPGGFDNNGFRDRSRTGSSEITPRFSSYTCQYWESGERIGELSWDHTTGVLTVHGSIYIDGDVRFDDDGDLVNYQGRATIYLSGDLEFDERVCAGGNGSFDCFNDPENWNPEQNQLVLLSGGWSEYDQGGTEPLRPAAFQGVIYATDHCLIRQDFHVSGPVICDEVRIRENDEDQGGGWPSFFDWPQLQTLVDGLVPPPDPDDLEVVVREEIS